VVAPKTCFFFFFNYVFFFVCSRIYSLYFIRHGLGFISFLYFFFFTNATPLTLQAKHVAFVQHSWERADPIGERVKNRQKV